MADQFIEVLDVIVSLLDEDQVVSEDIIHSEIVFKVLWDQWHVVSVVDFRPVLPRKLVEFKSVS